MEKKTPPWFKPLLKRFIQGNKGFLEFLLAISNSNDIIRLPILIRNYLLNDPNAIYHVLVENEKNYTKEGTAFRRVEEIVGKGLLTNSGDLWRKMREEVQPQFHFKNLETYVPIIHQCTQELLTQWKRYYKPKQKMNITDEMLKLVMNITAKVLLGINTSEEAPQLIKATHILNAFAVKPGLFFQWLPSLSNLRFQVARRYLDQFLMKSIQHQSLQNLENPPLLSNLLVKNADGELVLPEDKILGEIKNFFIAGHETTGNALSWLFYSLLKNRYVLTQVSKEIATVVGNREPSLSDLAELNFCEIAIQETLRLYPPIWILYRKAINDDIINGYETPAGTFISISPFLIHRNPLYWQNPHHFYPERFLPEASKNRPKCAFIPFGVGPRVCIGKQLATLSMKIILVTVLQNFELHLPYKDYTVKPLPLITLKPYKGIWLKIEKK